MRDAFLTTEELAERWAGIVSIGTIRNWRYKKKGPKYVKLGRRGSSHVFYRLDDVVSYEESMTRQTE